MSSQQAGISAADRADAETIWDFHQMHHQRRPCEAAIGLGSRDLGVATFAAKLYHAAMFPVVVFSGANSPSTAGRFPRGEAVHRDAADVQPGVMLIAGNRFGRAVVRVVAVDEDGQVHFTVLPGSLEKNIHLTGRRSLP